MMHEGSRRLSLLMVTLLMMGSMYAYADPVYFGNCYEQDVITLNPAITQVSVVPSSTGVDGGEEIGIDIRPRSLTYYCWTSSDKTGTFMTDSSDYTSIRWRAPDVRYETDIEITGQAGNSNGAVSSETVTIHVIPLGHRYDLETGPFELVNHDVFLKGNYRLDLEAVIFTSGSEEIVDDFTVKFVFSDDLNVGDDVAETSDTCRQSCREELNRDGYKLFIGDIHLPDYVEPGEYNILVQADFSGMVAETDEENNLSSIPVYIVDGTGSGSDLTVVNFRSDGRDDPLDVLFYEEISVELDVTNIGQMQSSQCSGTFYWSAVPQITDESIRLESYNINHLNPGESRHVLNSVLIPENVAEGTYYVLFFADDELIVNESDENNNIGLFAVNVHSGADLVVRNLRVNGLYDGIVVEPGQSLRIDADITNIGQTSRTQPTETGWYISTSTGVDGQVFFDYTHVPNIYPEQPCSTAGFFDLDMFFPPGNYYVIAEADTFDDFIEQNEDNNTAVIPFLVQGEPELEGIIVRSDNDTANVGDEFTVTATGYYSDNSSIDISDQVVWSTSSPTVLEYSGPVGRFTAIGPGYGYISAALDGIESVSYYVEVLESEPDPDPPLILKLFILKRIYDCLTGQLPRDSPQCSFLPD